MATTTDNYGFVTPSVGLEPFSPTIDAFAEAVDSTIFAVSGTLQSQISSLGSTKAIVPGTGILVSSGTSTIQISADTSVLATDAEVTTVSGHLQTQISSINIDEIEPAITGSDGITVTSGSSTTTIAGFRGEFVSASGSLQSQISAIVVDEIEPAIVGADGIIVTSGINTTTVAGFRTEFVSASGSLQSQINNLDSIYATDSNLTSVSGHLQTQISSIVADEVEPAIIGSDGITVTSGSSTTSLQGFRGEFVSASGNLQTQIDGKSSTSHTHDHGTLTGLSDDDHVQYSLVAGTRPFTGTVAGIDPILSSHLATKGYVDGTHDAITGTDGNTVTSGSNSINIASFRTEFVTASGYLQGQITTATSDVDSLNAVTGAVLATGTNGVNTITAGQIITFSAVESEIDHDQLQNFDQTEHFTVGSLKAITGDSFVSVTSGTNAIRLSADAIVGGTGVTVTSGSNTVTIAVDTTVIATDAEVVTISGHLQSQISSILVDEVEPAIIGTDGITVTSGSSTTLLTGFRSEFVSASGFLQTQITNAASDVDSINGLSGAVLVTGTNGVNSLTSGQTITLQAVESEIDHDTLLNFDQAEHFTVGSLKAVVGDSFVSVSSGINSINLTADAIIGGTGITIASGTSTVSIAIDDAVVATDANVTSVSGHLQTQITTFSDHGNLTGLSDDDHTQYILANGTRAFSGNQSLGGNNLTNVGTITATTVTGTSVQVGGTVSAQRGEFSTGLTVSGVSVQLKPIIKEVGFIYSTDVWQNMPVTGTILLGGSQTAARIRLDDLTGFNQARLLVNITTVSGAPNSVMRLKYSPTYTLDSTQYLDMTTAGSPQVSLFFENTILDSGWQHLLPEVKNEVYITVVGSGGDALRDPSFGFIRAMFR